MYARFKTRKWRAMTEADRIDDYLQRLTPLARSCLLTELERLEVCGDEIPGSAALLEKLRTEFRKNEQTHKGGQAPERVANPSRYFFNPLEPLLVNGAPEHANSGWILRGSLAPIWEWISRDLLPTMARDYVNEMKPLIAADKQQEARRVAAAFQTKVVKYLESTLGSPNGVNQTRIKLATYTASRAVCGDLASMVCVLRVRDALAKFSDALPSTIEKFDDARVSRITALLDAFGKDHAEALPFATALVAKRLKTPWQLIHLATKAASSKNAADIAATPYAITVSMVLDRLDDKRSALRAALKNNRVLAAKDSLTAVYDIERALRVRIDLLDGSAWGDRLNELMTSIAAMVEAEVSRFPASVNHVLGSRRLRSHQTMAGRLTRLVSRGRDAMSNGAAFCMKLAGRN
jgi:flagellin-specific chaperone FliS